MQYPITKLIVIDKKNRLLPLGFIGELCIGGIQVAKGYLNDEKLTKEKFVRFDFSPTEVFYKTGDLARVDHFGQFEHCGRMDDQIKIHGVRIELQEIKNSIVKFPGVKSAVCIHRKKTGSHHADLIAYITPKDINTEKLKSYLYKQLPHNMIPTALISLESFPVGSSGKVDIKSLPCLKKNYHTFLKNSVNRKLTQTEKQLKKIWHSALPFLSTIPINIPYTELGIDSIGLMKIQTNAFKEGIKIPIRLITQEKTIEKIAQSSSVKLSVYDEPDKKKSAQLAKILNSHISNTDKIVVIHSSLPNLEMSFESIEVVLKKTFSEWMAQGITIAIPCFTFNFLSGTPFHFKYSQSEVGVLPHMVQSWFSDAIRTEHPIYSFIMIGPLSQEINRLQSDQTCFGDDSIFDYFQRYNAKYLLMGTSEITHIHYYEEKIKVPYRYFKTFTGKVFYSEKSQAQNIQMYVRDLKVNPLFSVSSILRHLARDVKRNIFGSHWIQSVSCHDLESKILEKLQENNFIFLKNAKKVSNHYGYSPPICSVQKAPVHYLFENFLVHPDSINHFTHSVILDCKTSIDFYKFQSAAFEFIQDIDAFSIQYDLSKHEFFFDNKSRVDIKFSKLNYSSTSQKAKKYYNTTILSNHYEIHKEVPLKIFLLEFLDAQKIIIKSHRLSIDIISWNLIIQEFDTLCDRTSRIENESYCAQLQDFSLITESSEILNEVQNCDKIDIFSWKKNPKHWHDQEWDLVSQIQGRYQKKDSFIKLSHQLNLSNIQPVLICATKLFLDHLLSQKKLSILIESHGRHSQMHLGQIINTIGWLNSFYPILLENFSGPTQDYILYCQKQILKGSDFDRSYPFYFRKKVQNKESIKIPNILFQYLGKIDFSTTKNFSQEDFLISYGALPKSRFVFNFVFWINQEDFLCFDIYYQNSLKSQYNTDSFSKKMISILNNIYD